MTRPPFVLVGGGARSGKSRVAEQLAAASGLQRCYIATAQAGDGEMAERIRRHRDDRDAGWQTAQLGLLFTAQAIVLFGLLGYFSGAVGAWINRTPSAGKWMDRVAGAIFVGLGLRLIIAR